VPDFALIERSERPITRTDLRGLVWIVNFFYTHCPDTCPLQSARMARLQGDFADERDVRLVSISVDPEHDTAAVLRDYAQRFGADAERWLFLTGDKAAIYHLAQQGFHLSVVDPGAAPPQTSDTPSPGEQSGARRSLPLRGQRGASLTAPLPLPLRGQRGSAASSVTGALHLRSRNREARRLLSPPPLGALLRWVFVPRLAWAHAGKVAPPPATASAERPSLTGRFPASTQSRRTEHKTLLHSSRFVLVDRQARLRGYYHSDEDAAMRRLRRDVHTVLRER
jgi:cytochrome oxidase Cu insertion factor (SCO1/SenC/PrrC family)